MTKSEIYEPSATEFLRPGRVLSFHVSHGEASVSPKISSTACIVVFLITYQTAW